jgi:hypothetical protein
MALMQVNEFKITQEQLEQMRKLCDAGDPYKKPSISEGDVTSATATEELGHD